MKVCPRCGRRLRGAMSGICVVCTIALHKLMDSTIESLRQERGW